MKVLPSNHSPQRRRGTEKNRVAVDFLCASVSLVNANPVMEKIPAILQALRFKRLKNHSPQKQRVCCRGFSPLQPRPTPCGCRGTEKNKKSSVFLCVSVSLWWILLLTLLFTLPTTPAQAQPASCSAQIISVHATEAAADGSRPADGPAWRAVTLPDYEYDRAPYGKTLWYRIDWQRDCPPATQPAPVMLVTQSIFFAGEIFINDEWLWGDQSLVEPLSWSFNMPRHWRLPEVWLHEGVNTIWVRAVSLAGHPVGVGPIFLGDLQTMQDIYDGLMWNHRTIHLVTISISGAFTMLFFVIWLLYRKQTAYGWYALFHLLSTLFFTSILTTSPWPFTSTVTLERATPIALLLSIACFCVFTWRFGEQRLARTERALWITIAALIAVPVLVPDRYVYSAHMFCIMASVVIFFANAAQFTLHALRTRQPEHLWLAAGILLQSAATIYDILGVLRVINGSVGLSPYSGILTTVCFSIILGLRLTNNARRIERFNQELEHNITQTRIELGTVLEREHALALNNARLQDRLQVAHDLHDGAGGSLAQMVNWIEQSAEMPDQQKILSRLKFALADLRQTIDSNVDATLKSPATPQEWIAPLRRRYADLFHELGIALDWQIPEQWRAQPDGAQCQALARLTAEALTNIIKHSRARHAAVRLLLSGTGEITLRIEDDGIGFDAEAARQTNASIGMHSMRARITRAGGTLEITSRPGNTVLTARMPGIPSPLSQNAQSPLNA